MSDIKSRPQTIEWDKNWERIFNSCPRCKGTREDWVDTGNGGVYLIKCPVCNGTGKADNK